MVICVKFVYFPALKFLSDYTIIYGIKGHKSYIRRAAGKRTSGAVRRRRCVFRKAGISMNKPTRVALVTSGGDCQGLNAAMRGVAKSLFEHVEDLEIYGMYDGYRGLIERDYKFMEPKDFSGILTEGGTILGTSRQRYIPGKDIVDEDGNSLIPAMLDTYNRLNLDCLVIMGGNGTQKSAKLLMDAGMNVITLPKTIDNDIYGTDTTFGFQSAVDIATNVIDYIHSTASSHGRIFVVELMGRDAGWLTLQAGIGSGAENLRYEQLTFPRGEAFYLQCYRDAWCNAHGSDEGFVPELYARSAAKHAQEHPGSVVRVLSGDTVVGLVELDPARDEQTGCGWISLLYMLPEYRGRGWAIQLLGYAFWFYENHDRSAVRLHVSENNARAIAFYRRSGFVQLGRDPGVRERLLLMGRLIHRTVTHGSV